MIWIHFFIFLQHSNHHVKALAKSSLLSVRCCFWRESCEESWRCEPGCYPRAGTIPLPLSTINCHGWCDLQCHKLPHGPEQGPWCSLGSYLQWQWHQRWFDHQSSLFGEFSDLSDRRSLLQLSPSLKKCRFLFTWTPFPQRQFSPTLYSPWSFFQFWQGPQKTIMLSCHLHTRRWSTRQDDLQPNLLVSLHWWRGW